MLSNFAVDDTAATGGATYVIVDVLDDASENDAIITGVFDGKYGTTSTWQNPSDPHEKVYYALQGLLDGVGRAARDELITSITLHITDKTLVIDPEGGWLEKNEKNALDHYNRQKTALTMMYTFLYNKPDAISAWFSIVSTTLSGGSYAVAARPALGAYGAALGLMSIAVAASNPGGQGGNPGTNTRTLDDWYSQSNDALDEAYQAELRGIRKQAADLLATIKLSDPSSWLSQLEAAIVPMDEDKFKYSVFKDIPDYTGSSGLSGFDDAFVTVDLRDSDGNGRKDYTTVTSALNDKYCTVLDTFVYTGPPVPTSKAIFCEMLKEWAKKIATIEITPGHIKSAGDVNPFTGVVTTYFVWVPPQWRVANDYWNSPGFDEYDIVAKLNAESYFIDFDGVEWPITQPPQ